MVLCSVVQLYCKHRVYITLVVFVDMTAMSTKIEPFKNNTYAYGNNIDCFKAIKTDYCILIDQSVQTGRLHCTTLIDRVVTYCNELIATYIRSHSKNSRLQHG